MQTEEEFIAEITTATEGVYYGEWELDPNKKPKKTTKRIQRKNYGTFFVPGWTSVEYEPVVINYHRRKVTWWKLEHTPTYRKSHMSAVNIGFYTPDPTFKLPPSPEIIPESWKHSVVDSRWEYNQIVRPDHI